MNDCSLDILCDSESNPAFRERDGFTLIELLAVIVIISLVTGVLGGNFAAMNESQMFSAAAARVRDMDARARLLGLTGEPMMLATTSERDGLVVYAKGWGELVSSVEMPKGVRIHLALVLNGGEAVAFDTFGRSADYVFTLTGEDRIVSWDVSGLTGGIERRETIE